MNVWEVTLIAIGAPVLIILCAGLFLVPVVWDIKATQAQKDVPREVFANHQQRVFGLPANHFWTAAFILWLLLDISRWLKFWSDPNQIIGKISFAILTAVLTYQLIWAIRIVRSRASLDPRLVRFARYAVWGYALGLLVVTASLTTAFTTK